MSTLFFSLAPASHWTVNLCLAPVCTLPLSPSVNFDLFWVANRGLYPHGLSPDAADGDSCLAVRVLVPGKPMLQRRFPLVRPAGKPCSFRSYEQSQNAQAPEYLPTPTPQYARSPMQHMCTPPRCLHCPALGARHADPCEGRHQWQLPQSPASAAVILGAGGGHPSPCCLRSCPLGRVACFSSCPSCGAASLPAHGPDRPQHGKSWCGYGCRRPGL
jgi:hypothetical protein